MVSLAALLAFSALQTNISVVVYDDLKIKDKGRGKDLSVRVSFPKQAGSYPVIVFSHGLGGSQRAMEPLVQPWVKAGYVVIQPEHEDSGVFKSAADLKKPKSQLIGNPIHRTQDISLVLDSLPVIDKEVPGLKGKMDMKTVGMAGHSYGAWTTMAIGGLKLRSRAAQQVKLSDERPLCLVPISPQGVSDEMDASSYGPISRPTLSISGTEDTSVIFPEAKPEGRRDLFNYQKPGDKYLLWIDGATHGFGGITGSRGFGVVKKDQAMVDLIVRTTTLFFDAYLKKKTEAKIDLTRKNIGGQGAPKFEFLSK